MHIANPFDDGARSLEAKTATLVTGLLVVNGAAWLAALAAFAGNPILVGTAVLAYMLGLRHAFDVDHIAAIDNVVRKLVQDGKRPLSTGFFFALGHSTLVVLACLVFVATTPAGPDPGTGFEAVSAPLGTLVSASFLLVIGIANLLVLRTLWRMAARPGDLATGRFDAALDERGCLARLLRPLLRAVSQSWHFYPIGFLFGLGFDTAAEIGLVGVSAMQSAQGLSVGQIMIFPVLFTAGMTLFDTIDSVAMTKTYGWAFVRPERKLRYNLVITAISAVAAVAIGGIELAGLLRDGSEVVRPIWNGLAGQGEAARDLALAGVVVLASAALVSFAIFRRRRYENLPRSPGESGTMTTSIAFMTPDRSGPHSS